MSKRRSSISRRAPSRRPTRAWMVGLGAAVLAGALLLAVWLRHAQAPPLPQIDTAALSSQAVRLIEEQRGAVRDQPRSGAAWGKLGAILKSFDFSEAALSCLQEAQRLAPREPRWPYLQVSLVQEQSFSNALDLARRAVALCGNDPPRPRLQLARMLMETGQRQEARQNFQALLAADPGLGPARLGLAQIAQAEGRWEEALTLAQDCITNPYTARTAWTLISTLQWRLGQTNAALRAGRQAASTAPDATFPDPFEMEFHVWRQDARSLSDQAQDYLLAGRQAEAVPLVERLVKEYPQFSETWLLLGRLAFLQKDLSTAEQALRHHLQLDPQSADGHFQLGMCLLAGQRYPEAVGAFEQAIALKPSFGPAHFNLAFALVKSGQPTEAIRHFEEAIGQNPEHIDSYILLSDLHLQMGHSAEAIHWATLAQSISPSDPRLAALQNKILHR